MHLLSKLNWRHQDILYTFTNDLAKYKFIWRKTSIEKEIMVNMRKLPDANIIIWDILFSINVDAVAINAATASFSFSEEKSFVFSFLWIISLQICLFVSFFCCMYYLLYLCINAQIRAFFVAFVIIVVVVAVFSEDNF